MAPKGTRCCGYRLPSLTLVACLVAWNLAANTSLLFRSEQTLLESSGAVFMPDPSAHHSSKPPLSSWRSPLSPGSDITFTNYTKSASNVSKHIPTNMPSKTNVMPVPRSSHSSLRQDIPELSSDPEVIHDQRIRDIPKTNNGSCAILFFGLPRAFKLYVLPSIIENVLIPNLDNNCDYYFHYFHLESEGKNRAGNGGKIFPDDVYLLRDAIKYAHEQRWCDKADIVSTNDTTPSKIPPLPHLSITNSTMDEFWDVRGDVVRKYESTLDKNGRYLYFPTKSQTWHYPESLHNVVKQWHSISAVWADMEDTAQHVLNRKTYNRVAMLRNDVAFVTSLDIYRLSDTKLDTDNQYVVIPDWANHPINDRMISGPYDAVKIWATQRFQRIERHVRTYKPSGWGIHSERFLDFSIFPVIRKELGYELYQDPNICFLRARADGSVWLQDCRKGFKVNTLPLMKDLLRKYHSQSNNLICETQLTQAVLEQVILVCTHNVSDARHNNTT